MDNVCIGNDVCGTGALTGTSVGNFNVGIGGFTLNKITNGEQNVALGRGALQSLTTGDQNFALGRDALNSMTTGGFNVAIGRRAGRATNGNANVLIGREAGGASGSSFSGNTLIGYRSGILLTSGSTNIFLGQNSGVQQTTISNLLLIDNQIRASATAELTDSLIIGMFASNPSYQNITLNANLLVNGDANISQNLTANLIYGDMAIHAHPELEIVIGFQGVYTNITGMNFSMTNGVQAIDNRSLIPDVSGVYKVDYSVSFSGGANVEYDFVIAVNEEVQHMTHSHRKTGTATDIGTTAGTGFISVSSGNIVNLQVLNEDNNANINVFSANFNMFRIGDIR